MLTNLEFQLHILADARKLLQQLLEDELPQKEREQVGIELTGRIMFLQNDTAKKIKQKAKYEKLRQR